MICPHCGNLFAGKFCCRKATSRETQDAIDIEYLLEKARSFDPIVHAMLREGCTIENLKRCVLELVRVKDNLLSELAKIMPAPQPEVSLVQWEGAELPPGWMVMPNEVINHNGPIRRTKISFSNPNDMPAKVDAVREKILQELGVPRRLLQPAEECDEPIIKPSQPE